VPLLYAPGINIYPSQINGDFGYRSGGDSQQLVKNGLYNDELARQWQADADFIVTEPDWQSPSGDFNTTKIELFQTEPTNPCAPNSYLLVFKGKP
jgi:hypothetical protein